MTRYYDRLLKDTLLKQMKKGPLDSISVLSLCREADVNRKTFYNHYNGMSDLICRMITDRLDEIETEKITTKNWDHFTSELMNIMKKYQEFLRAVTGSSYANDALQAYRNRIDEYCDEFVDSACMDISQDTGEEIILHEPYHSYLSMFYSSLMSSIIEKWFLNGMKESIEDIVSLISELTSGDVYSGIEKYGKKR